ncbi:MAG TPA: YraN family protein [Thermoanaerobaculia bacterium]|nr:YraN family protein [Thermoanaerobaculia bacterium]
MMVRRRIASRLLGRLGEWRAAWFYRLHGYRIIGRNIRLRGGEIDLVARRGRMLVIVEVKTRQTLAAGEGHVAVDGAKRSRLIRLADQYLARSRPETAELRYDILSLFWNGWWFDVAHYPDAFRPVADPARPWEWRA